MRKRSYVGRLLFSSVCLLILAPAGLHAEDQQTSTSVLNLPAGIRLKDVALTTALHNLSVGSGVSIAFSPSLFGDHADHGDPIVSCACEKVSIAEALDRLLDPEVVEYFAEGGQVIVRPRRTIPDSLTPGYGPRALLTTRTRADDTDSLAVMLADFARPVVPAVLVGTVVDASDQRPIAGALVRIVEPEPAIETVTDADGRFRFEDAPEGTITLRVTSLGYRATETAVQGGATDVVIAMPASAISLDEIVATGVSGEVQRAKLPFVVDNLNAAELPVPSQSVSGSLQGKVAGVKVIQGSGLPGSSFSVQLRGATSINAEGRSQEPLFIVDGVILGTDPVDIASQDIERVEVVKGAAAASLYGSRAANGVVQIWTERGTRAPTDDTRVIVRNEFGTSDLERSIDLNRHHPYTMNEGGTAFVDPEGNEVGFLDAQLTGTSFTSFFDQDFPGPIFSHVDRFFNPGSFWSNYIAVQGNTPSTNYHLSFSNDREQGIVRFHEGFERQNFRLNLDHRIRDGLQVSANGFFGRSDQDDLQATIIDELVGMRPDVDLLQRNDAGQLEIYELRSPGIGNPLVMVEERETRNERDRFLGGAELAWAPSPLFSIEAALSYDQYWLDGLDFVPKGFRSFEVTAFNEGQISLTKETGSAFNASITSSHAFTLGDLQADASLRYLVETQHRQSVNTFGRNLSASLPNLEVVQSGLTVSENEESIRSEGFFLIGGLDYKDRYIGDFVVRRDGSSLFGAEQRWHTYFRGSGAYRVSEEQWFDIDPVTELKLRYSYGTAGGRPNFFAQYETFNVAGGVIRPVTLGNRALKPELATEREMGLDLLLWDRLGLSVTYANTDVQDQLLPVPLPTHEGFVEQWQNAGSLESQIWEVSLNAQIISGDDLSWDLGFRWDQLRQRITSLDAQPFLFGGIFRGASAFYVREDELFGTFYGVRWAQTCGDLAADVDCGQFQVNDDGYLVYVGNASWQDGISQALWGTTGETGGQTYAWGMPIKTVEENGEACFCAIGNVTPDYSFSVTNSVRWGPLSLYALVDAEIGADIYNAQRQAGLVELSTADLDQADKPEDRKKPIAYYGVLYDANGVNDAWIEDGTYVKLREVSVTYDVPDSFVQSFLPMGIDRVRIGLTGRNLKTWTDYAGFDPEVGVVGGAAGSAAIQRINQPTYPNFRRFSAMLEVIF